MSDFGGDVSDAGFEIGEIFNPTPQTPGLELGGLLGPGAGSLDLDLDPGVDFSGDPGVGDGPAFDEALADFAPVTGVDTGLTDAELAEIAKG